MLPPPHPLTNPGGARVRMSGYEAGSMVQLMPSTLVFAWIIVPLSEVSASRKYPVWPFVIGLLDWLTGFHSATETGAVVHAVPPVSQTPGS